MMKLVLLLPLLVAGLRLAVKTTSPVEKVVQLITELKSKIEADAATEQKTYNKFACWCETTTQRKANNIEDGKSLIGTSTTKILTLKGGVAVLASEIADYETKIAENNEAMKQATAIREKENSDYQQDKAYMETAIASLHQAVEVLSGAGTGLKLLTAASKVRSSILDAPQLAALSEQKSKILKTFLESPDLIQAKTKYAPQSATVTGILKDMYDTFAADLEKTNSEESTAHADFEAIMATKTEKNKEYAGIVTAKAAEKAEKSQQLAETEQLLGATQDQLKADEDFFATASTSCKEKSDSWDERGRLRTEELTGINDALKILTSDEARATFSSATSTRPMDTFGSDGVSFVQVDADHSPNVRAFRRLKQLVAGSKNSVMLARLAATVRVATKGHFDDVITSIDEMITTLSEEGAEDIKQRDWCIEDRNTNRNDRDDRAYEISQLESKIERAEIKKKGLEKDVTRTEGDKADLIADMATALADRTAENENFHAAKDDDEKAIGLLEQAAAALSAYGENNAPAALLQKKQDPVFEVSEDQAPDATFSDQGKHAGASNGIVQLLTQIKENLQNEVEMGTTAEAKAVEEYDALKANADTQIEAYDNQLTDLAASIASVDAAIEEDGNTKTDVTGQHDSTVDYLSSIKANCDWIESAFTKRATARAAESEGLQEAKAILAGSE